MDAEDSKLVTLARAALGRALVRTMVPAGAAVRDDMGRTYAAASVEVDGASVTALQLAVASAISSGARAFEAAAIVSEDTAPDEEGSTALNAFGPVPTVIRALPDGTIVE
ncbi:MAG TPA: cytidine deaminase [Frankiaceae bacterium]|nr:cytidine deaminase [Frankiaceae bacterium]